MNYSNSHSNKREVSKGSKGSKVSTTLISLSKRILANWGSLYNFVRRFYHFMSALEPNIRMKIFVSHAIGIISNMVFLVGSLVIVPFINYVIAPESSLNNKWLGGFHDTVTQWTDIDFAIILGLASVIALVIARGGHILGQYIGALINMQLNVYYTTKLFHYYIHNSALDSQATTSEIVNAINNRLPGIISGFINPVFSLINTFFFLGTGLVILYLLEPWLLLFAAGLVVLLLTFSISATRQRINRYSDEINQLNLTQQRRLLNSIGAREYIQMIGKQNVFSKNFAIVKKQLDNNNLKLGVIGMLFAPLGEMMIYAFMVFVSLYIIVFTEQSNIQLATAFLIIIYRMFPQVTNLFNTYISIRGGVIIYDSVSRELLQAMVAKVSYEPHIRNPLPFVKSIKLKNVSYHYAQQKPQEAVLKKINLEIPCGKKIGICGLSGSGKTTLLRMITGRISPRSGEVTVDGNPLKGHKTIRRWQDSIGYVSQNLVLIERSIADNITLAIDDEEVDEKQLRKSMNMAEASKFVSKMPQKEHTQAGEAGSSMSGGQRQRIVIARALYYKPSLLIFDEATSSLDKSTESKILSNISEDKTLNETFIFVTHRLDTIKHCDLIILLDAGRVKAKGTYQDLINLPEFRKLTGDAENDASDANKNTSAK